VNESETGVLYYELDAVLDTLETLEFCAMEDGTPGASLAATLSVLAVVLSAASAGAP